MIELEYQKAINDSLNSIITSYDEEIANYKSATTKYESVIEKQNKKINKLKNKNKVCIGVAGTSIILMILGILL